MKFLLLFVRTISLFLHLKPVFSDLSSFTNKLYLPFRLVYKADISNSYPVLAGIYIKNVHGILFFLLFLIKQR